MMFDGFWSGMIGGVFGPAACLYLRRYRYSTIFVSSMAMTMLSIAATVVYDLGWSVAIKKVFSDSFYTLSLGGVIGGVLAMFVVWFSVLVHSRDTKGQPGSDRSRRGSEK